MGDKEDGDGDSDSVKSVLQDFLIKHILPIEIARFNEPVFHLKDFMRKPKKREG